MSQFYGDGWLELLYDVATVVRTTEPDETVRRIHDIQLKKYLVLPGTDTVFPPPGLFDDDHKWPAFYWQSKDVIMPGYRDGKPWYPQHERIDLEKAEVDSPYVATLHMRVTQVTSELKKRDITWTDGVNVWVYNPEELEGMMKKAKEEMKARLRTAGMPVDDSKFYWLLGAISSRF